MLDSKTIGVIVPAFNEETQIELVIKNMPEFVDRIVVINDYSSDRTAEIVQKLVVSPDNISPVCIPIPPKLVSTLYNAADIKLEKIRKNDAKRLKLHEVYNKDPDNSRIILINSLENGGVGSAMSIGYMWCRDRKIDCTASMNGDGQMAPDELGFICEPIIDGTANYVKGNRLSHPAAAYIIPRVRFLGNSILSLLTKFASGYWQLSDTQTGYTAIKLSALETIDIAGIYPYYGVPNDILVKLNMAYCTITEIQIKPVYAIGEQSKMKVRKVIPRMLRLLTRLFFKRIFEKYFLKNLHPLFLFYMYGFISGFSAFVFTVYIIVQLFVLNGSVATGEYIVFLLLFTSSLQSLGFAMWMDIQDNKDLQIKGDLSKSQWSKLTSDKMY